MSVLIDIAGRKFSRWSVLHRLPNRRGGYAVWMCRCDCGTERAVLSSHLRRGKSISCGCHAKEVRASQVGENHPRWKGGRRVRDGYVYLTGEVYPGSKPHNQTAEHVVVMARHLGRALTVDESVHHKNGIRDDNRIENLELWCKPQPTGCRTADAVEWAKMILLRYEPESLSEGKASGE